MATVTADTVEAFARENAMLAARMLPDGRYITVTPMMFNLRITLGTDDKWCDDSYCYHDNTACWVAWATFDGVGEPTGWYKHVQSGRRRPDGTPESEYIDEIDRARS